MRGKGVEYRSEKMTIPVLPKIGFIPPMSHGVAAKPLSDQAACMQEQFTGQVAARNERPMAEIIKERLAEANPACQCPVFIP